MKIQLVVAVFALCGISHAGELADYYQAHLAKDPVTFTNLDWGHDKPSGITEIGLERGVCFGTCPAYTVVIRSDGGVRYYGQFNTPRKGKFTGKVSPYYFNKLAAFVVESQFTNLADNYTAEVTDQATVFTCVTQNGKHKVVRDYGQSGPAKLWAIDELIDDLVEKTVWDKKVVKPVKKGGGKGGLKRPR